MPRKRQSPRFPPETTERSSSPSTSEETAGMTNRQKLSYLNKKNGTKPLEQQLNKSALPSLFTSNEFTFYSLNNFGIRAPKPIKERHQKTESELTIQSAEELDRIMATLSTKYTNKSLLNSTYSYSISEI